MLKNYNLFGNVIYLYYLCNSKREQDMTQNNIAEALKIMNYRDWTWEMAESNYMGRYNAAKSEMKKFVATVNGIEDAEVREALRRFWTLRYNELHASYTGKEFNEKEELAALENRFAYAA